MKDKKILITASVLLFLIGTLYLIQQGKNNTSNVFNQNTIAPKQKISTARECTGQPTPSQTEGPYYKTGSPKRKNITEDVSGEKLVVTGFVYDSNCQPIASAWLDFWQADSNGQYDNQGYILRGHQFTDENGKYNLETIVPAAYETRPSHIHVKVRNGNGPVLTSQLYFPDETQNTRDSIFNAALVMKISEENGGTVGTFDFILP